MDAGWGHSNDTMWCEGQVSKPGRMPLLCKAGAFLEEVTSPLSLVGETGFTDTRRAGRPGRGRRCTKRGLSLGSLVSGQCRKEVLQPSAGHRLLSLLALEVDQDFAQDVEDDILLGLPMQVPDSGQHCGFGLMELFLLALCDL